MCPCGFSRDSFKKKFLIVFSIEEWGFSPFYRVKGRFLCSSLFLELEGGG